MLGGVFILFKNFNRKNFKQTAETQVRPPLLNHLIWVCTVCICPTKRTLGLYVFINALRNNGYLSSMFSLSLTLCMLSNVSCFCGSLRFSFKISFFKKLFQEHYQSIKRLGSRTGQTCCLSISGSNLFAKVISKEKKLKHKNHNTCFQEFSEYLCRLLKYICK